MKFYLIAALIMVSFISCKKEEKTNIESKDIGMALETEQSKPKVVEYEPGYKDFLDKLDSCQDGFKWTSPAAKGVANLSTHSKPNGVCQYIYHEAKVMHVECNFSQEDIELLKTKENINGFFNEFPNFVDKGICSKKDLK